MAAKKAAAAKKLAAIRKKAAAKKNGKKPEPRNHAGKNLSTEFVDRQWKPGQSGNPAGRPKRKSIWEIVLDKLDALYPGRDPEDHDETSMEAVAKVFLDEVIMHRNDKSMKELLARIWPITQKIELVNTADDPINVAIEVDFTRLSQVERKALLRLHEKAASVGGP